MSKNIDNARSIASDRKPTCNWASRMRFLCSYVVDYWFLLINVLAVHAARWRRTDRKNTVYGFNNNNIPFAREPKRGEKKRWNWLVISFFINININQALFKEHEQLNQQNLLKVFFKLLEGNISRNLWNVVYDVNIFHIAFYKAHEFIVHN